MPDIDYWLKQEPGKPLFQDLLWSRPENRQQSGRLLIVGGNAHGFAAPAQAYKAAEDAGAGVVRVLLPDALRKTVGNIFEASEYAPSNQSGSFSQLALDELLSLASWANAVLIAGELGHNSETAVVLEKFAQKYTGQLCITRDSVDYFTDQPLPILNRNDTLVVCSLAQLQKFCRNAKFTTPITFSMDLLHLVEVLHQITSLYKLAIIVKHLQTIFVALDGRVSTTKLVNDIAIWRVKTAAAGAVWQLQNTQKSFEALTTAMSLLES